ncbi:MAG: hypothetical protein OEV55_02465 [candidate division Zixibacteria bacterium]|nr:hypothetical protein [candidate division Zixibacteria bacterium]
MKSARLELRLLILILGIFFTITTHQQQTLAQEKINPLEKYQFHCYCTTIRSTPQAVIKLDNNGQILVECLPGKTVQQLTDGGTQFTESQIRLLKDWGLLQEEEGILKTTFPILDVDRTNHLRKLMKESTAILSQNLKEEIISLIAELKSINRGKNAYTILFSYVLDDLVWDLWEEKEILKRREISQENPLWTGEFWVVYPARTLSCGTNSISDKGVSLKVNWSEKAIKKMLPFVTDWVNLSKMFDNLVEKGKVEDEKAIQVFGPYNLFDSSGRFTVPIILESEDNKLYQKSLQLSKNVSNQVLDVIDLENLKNEFDFRDKEQALIIAYHELMWELLDYLEQERIIQKPVAFANPDKAEPKDIGDLVFIVKTSKTE